MKILRTDYLTFVGGASSKFYRLSLDSETVGDKTTFTTYAEFGRLGAANPQKTTKYTGDDEAAANEAYDKALAEKEKKGYTVQ